MKTAKHHRPLRQALAFGLFTLFAAAPATATTGTGSTTANLDTRDYTLEVTSAHGDPTPAAGLHDTYAWHATVTCTAGADADYTCTGWTGTGSIPATGTANTTGEITLDEVTSSITWNWETDDSDDDNDSLPNAFEDAIIAADLTDGITSYADIDGTGDFDRDGRTDAEEFADGTDPTDPGSTLGLVAYYPLDGNANDASGNGHDGVATNMAWSDAVVGQGGDFNGTDAYIDLGVSSNIMSGPEATFSFWVQALYEEGRQQDLAMSYFGGYGTLGDLTILLAPETNGYSLRVDYGVGSYVDSGRGGTTDIVLSCTGEWHYVTTVIDTANTVPEERIKTFFDGARVAFSYWDWAQDGFETILGCSEPLGLGTQPNRRTNFLKGKLDDVRIYDRALDADEVAALYEATAPTNTVSSYQLIEGSFTWHEAKADAEARGGHLACFPTESDWLDMLAQVGSSIDSGMWWFGATDEETEGVWRWVSAESWNFSNWNTGQPDNHASRQHCAHTSGSVVNHQWGDDWSENTGLTGYLLELPDDDNDSLPNAFEDAIIAADLTDDITDYSDIDGTGDFDRDGRTDAQEYADGTVPTDPGSTLGLLAYYPFDGDATDASGNGHDGTVEYAIPTTDRHGLSNRAYAFPSTSDVIWLPFGTGWNPFSEPISVSLWVEMEFVGSQVFFNSRSAANDRLYICASPERNWAIGVGDRGYSQANSVASTNWTLLTVVLDYGTATLYANGIVSHSISYSSYVLGSDFQVGQEATGPYANNSFDGSIDEVRIYDRALDAEEVAALYAATAPADSDGDGMVAIPAGSNAGTDPDLGAYSLTVERFYMGATEVTYADWQTVHAWAVANGYSFDNAGGGKGSDHPVHSVNWYDCVKWCNARSEMDGLTPCYTVSGNIYRMGQSTPDCDFDANGYRLPTKTEWEYAARGGLKGKRFPWGDTISHDNANYRSSTDDGFTGNYDLSLGANHHPDYATGGTPYTNPVRDFAANGYGLYGMAGNVRELIWDRDPLWNPLNRQSKGGSWHHVAWYPRCANWSSYSPGSQDFAYGFRVVATAPGSGATPHPDLTSSLRILNTSGNETANPAVGETVNLEVTVTNNGDAATSEAIDVRVFEGSAPTDLTSYNLGSYIVAASTTVAESIPVGGSRTVILPWTISGGDRISSLTAVVEFADNRVVSQQNYDNTASDPLPVSEWSFANNSAARSVQIGTPDPTGYGITIIVDPIENPQSGVAYTLSGTAAYDWGDENPVLGADVTVHLNGATVGTDRTAGPDGNWSVGLPGMASGLNTVFISVSDGGLTDTEWLALDVAAGAQTTDLRVTQIGYESDDSGVYRTSGETAWASVGSDVVLKALVRNDGNTAAGSFTVAFKAPDGSIIATETVASLGAFSQTWVTAQTAWTTSATGAQSVTAECDSAGAITETNEDNNSRSATVHVSADLPDLVVSDISWAGTPREGDLVTVTATIRNDGPGTLASGPTVDVRFLLAGSVTDTASVALLSDLAYGESTTAQVTLSTTDLGVGGVSLSAEVDTGAVVAELNESNNTHTETLSIATALPDLIVSDISWTPSSPKNGDTVTVTATIRNNGGSAVSAGTSFDVGMDIDGPSTVAHTLSSDLAPGGSVNVATTWTAVTGNQSVTATADSGSVIDEDYESNNTRSETISVRAALPDLRPYSLRYGWQQVSGLSFSPSDPTAGDAVTITLQVWNVGTVAVPTGSYAVEFTAGGTPFATESLVLAAPLQPGASTTVQSNWTASGDGGVSIAASVDSATALTEENEGNNATAKSLTVYPASAGVNVSGLVPSVWQPFSDTAITLTATVVNRGGQPSTGGHVVTFYDGDPDAGGTEIGSATITDPLAAKGGSSTAAINWTTPVTPQTVTVYAVCEGSERTVDVVVTNTPAPDLAIYSSDISVSNPLPAEGASVSVSADVQNLAGGESDVSVVFEYNTAGLWLPLGQPVILYQLAAGETETDNATQTLTASAYYYTVRVTVTPTAHTDANADDNAATTSFRRADAPWANAGADQEVWTGETVTLDGTASANASTYQWTLASQPVGSNATLSDQAAVSPTFTADVAGSYEVRLIVSDGSIDSPQDTVVIAVTDGYTLTYTAGPGGSIAGASSQTVGYGGNGSPVEAVEDAGYHFVGWSDGSTENPRADEAVTAGIAVTAHFAANLPTALDTTDMVWETGGDAAWHTQTLDSHDGEDAARSGPVGDNGTTWLQTTVTGPGQLTFHWRVSSESDYDWMRLQLDDLIVRSISGDTSWAEVSLRIKGDGDHRLRWLYTKDFSLSEGEDGGWLDQVTWVPDLDGFALWAHEHALSGHLDALFMADRNNDGIINGFEYAFGANLPPGTPLLRMTRVGAQRVVELPVQPADTLEDVQIRVMGSTDLDKWTHLETPVGWLGAPPENHHWFMIEGDGDAAFYKLEAELTD